MHNISLENPDLRANGFRLKKFESTFRLFFSSLKEPSFHSAYLVRLPSLTGMAVLRVRNLKMAQGYINKPAGPKIAAHLLDRG